MSASRFWSERWGRPGWSVAYTPAGGSLRGGLVDLAIARHGEGIRRSIDRLTGQAMVASDAPAAEVSPDTAYFCAVATKIFQRGHAPFAPRRVEGHLLERLGERDLGAVSRDAWLSAAIGPPDGPFELDGSIKLDGVYEQKLWDQIATQLPHVARFTVPQASLEGMIGADGVRDTVRWVDFALSSPWRDRTIVVELDGAQHASAARIDAARDKALHTAGHLVSRHPGPEVLSPTGGLWRGLAATEAMHKATDDPDLVALLHGPAVPTRLGLALVHLLGRGSLVPGGIWDLEIHDPLGVASVALLDVLEIFAALAEVWSLDVAPTEVRVGGATLRRDGPGYTVGRPSGADPTSRARVFLAPFTPAHAELPTRTPSVATVVVRGAFVPAALPWLTTPPVPRRVVEDRPQVAAGLVGLLPHLFGYDTFRPGQESAILHALAGRDACVLLPTGTGKSLIYQLAGLLQPGTTLVVDPLVSLIDDQHRRLVEDRVDRVVGLHSGRVGSADERDAIHAAIADGEALFVFLTPERLQNQGFRDALGAAARHHTINLAVVDEAHCVSEWGHDFRTAYLRVGRNLRGLCRGDDDVEPQVLALTGTASPAVLRDMLRELEAPGRSMVVESPVTFDRSELSYAIVRVPRGGWQAGLRTAIRMHVPTALGCDVEDLIRSDGPSTKSGLVFVPHVNGAFGLEAARQSVAEAFDGFEKAIDGVGVYAGSRPKGWAGDWDAYKVRNANGFTRNDLPVLVSTKAFGMGIDKPNIRWTVHVGFPSSIESFAQEAGRAGRDRERSHCILVVTPPESSRASALLDLQRSREQRREIFDSQKADDDLQRQLFFLNNSFAGIEEELVHSRRMLKQLLVGAPGSRVEVVRTDARQSARKPVRRGGWPTTPPVPDEQSSATEQEKALYRLSMLGIVDDYTVNHGAGSFVVDLDQYDVAHLDRQVVAFVQRVEPGKSALRLSQIASAPADLPGRAEHHLQLLLAVLYEVIEPGRLQALRGMYDLAVQAGTDQEIRDRINGYLADGPLAGILLEQASSVRIDVATLIAVLDTVPCHDPQEWIGTATRYLEMFPDHPVLLMVRALGEAMHHEGDAAVVRQSVRAVFDGFGDYGVAVSEGARLFQWSATQLRNQRQGKGWRHLPAFYQAWDEAGLPPDALEATEQDALGLAQRAGARIHPGELAVVLGRQMDRMAELTSRLVGPTVHTTS